MLFSAQPFTSALVMSNVNMFKYEWIWKKNRGTGHLNAKKMPLAQHENVLIFCNGVATYNPQKTKGEPYQRLNCSRRTKNNAAYGKTNKTNDTISLGERYPLSVVMFDKVERTLHPTEKPVKLMEYLIKTYTNEGEAVLDFTMGSGTTGVACILNNRNFIGIELDQGYFEICEKRIEEAKKSIQLSLF